MSEVFYREDDIAIISVGAVLPDADNPEQFWDNVKIGKSSIKEISEDRWNKSRHFSPYRELDDKTYSHYGAEISQKTYGALREKHGLEIKEHSQLDIIAIEAMSQVVQGVQLPPDPKKVGMVLGIMNPDEFLFSNQYYNKKDEVKEKLLKQYDSKDHAAIEEIADYYTEKNISKFDPHIDFLLPMSTIEKLKKRFQIEGPSFCVDAACASSLASIDICAKKLRAGEIDLAFAGGLESNLSPGAFVLFSKVGALAVEQCRPLDKDSDGLSQGEGAVIFALKRLSDAKRDKNDILGVVRSCAGTSDGRVASLFQPSLGGQLLAYTLAHKPFENNRIDYLELHGTGTKVGDLSEASSTSAFFKDYKIPIGSVKALVGHTKATAGATGLLKCLYMMKHEMIPPSPYYQDGVLPPGSTLFINKKPIKLESRKIPLKMAVSSFGFGGCNYHLVVESYRDDVKIEKALPVDRDIPLVVVGQAVKSFEDYDPSWFTSKDAMYRLPPKSLPQIDRVQLLAVRAAQEAFESAGIHPDRLASDKVAVISASTIGLDILEHMSMRITLDSMSEALKEDVEEGRFDKDHLLSISKKLFAMKDEYEPVTEDSGPGILNNVIAGRICNAFNFKGRNLNIDCDRASVAAALTVIENDLKDNPDELIILIGVHEEIDTQAKKVIREKVSCHLITSLKNAKKEMFQVQNLVQTGTNNGN